MGLLDNIFKNLQNSNYIGMKNPRYGEYFFYENAKRVLEERILSKFKDEEDLDRNFCGVYSDSIPTFDKRKCYSGHPSRNYNGTGVESSGGSLPSFSDHDSAECLGYG